MSSIWTAAAATTSCFAPNTSRSCTPTARSTPSRTSASTSAVANTWRSWAPAAAASRRFLNLLGALDWPTSGEVFFDGQPLSKVRSLDRLRSQKFGFVFQSFHLLPILTSVENVQVPMFEGTLSAAARVKKAKELLELVGMGHRANHLPQKLSVGERQRVAIARSLANDPIALLADEPTGNLDSRSAEGVFDLFAHLHHEQGMTIVLITHDEQFGQLAQRTIRMQDGHVKSDVFSGHRRARTPLPPFAV